MTVVLNMRLKILSSSPLLPCRWPLSKTHVKTLREKLEGDEMTDGNIDHINKPSSHLPAIQWFILFTSHFFAWSEMWKSPPWGHHGRRKGSLLNFECQPQRHLEGDQDRLQNFNGSQETSQGVSHLWIKFLYILDILLLSDYFFLIVNVDPFDL